MCVCACVLYARICVYTKTSAACFYFLVQSSYIARPLLSQIIGILVPGVIEISRPVSNFFPIKSLPDCWVRFSGVSLCVCVYVLTWLYLFLIVSYSHKYQKALEMDIPFDYFHSNRTQDIIKDICKRSSFKDPHHSGIFNNKKEREHLRDLATRYRSNKL